MRSRPEEVAVLTDFDGTLAPIVAEADRAVPLDGVPGVLARLAARYGVVGVVSGRPVGYLQARIGPVPGVVLAGLYGMERSVDGHVHVEEEAARWTRTVEEVATAADSEAPAGVGVERKGLAMALHYRQAPDQRPWVEGFARRYAASTGLLAHPGRQVVELLPPVTADKGTVVTDLARGRSAACFLGDDRGDLQAFAALARLRQRGLTTLAVAVASDETPPELVEAADAVVDGPEGALVVLSALAE